MAFVFFWSRVVRSRPVPTLSQTTLWQEACALPRTLDRTLGVAEGFRDVVAMMRGAGRVVVTGNGAAFYAAHALWLATLETRYAGPELIAVPAGLLSRGSFAWRRGDLLLAISSSGEQRDVIEAVAGEAPRPFAVITSSAGSTLAREAAAIASVTVEAQDAITHTQAYCGNVAAALALWADVSGDGSLADALAAEPERLEATLDEAAQFADGDGARLPRDITAAVAFGTGTAWAAALEAALLLKEVSRLPAEGLETREGATSGMYALGRGQLALSLPAGPGGDPLLDEAERTCAATGAAVVRAPGGGRADRRLASITTFPAALALAVALGLRSGHDVDHPGWVDAYYATARVDEEG